MNSKLLLDNWELFVNNISSISDLRQLIIDIAIKGQLSGKSEKGEQGYPIDWEISDFGKICDIEGGSQPPKTTFISEPKEGYIQLFQIRDLGPKPAPVYIPVELAKSVSVEGEILVGRYGASVGKIFRAKKGAYNVALVKFIFPREKLLSDFVYWLLKSTPSQSLFTGMSRSAQAGFNKGDLKPLLIPIPSKEEQAEIIKTINSFMVMCDQLEKSLIESSQIAEKFARSVVSNLA
jgi:type I restriction enzyme S subunit